MSWARSLCRLPGCLAASLALAAIALPAAGSAATIGPKQVKGPLSPVLTALARPAVAAKPPAVQAARVGVLGYGPGSLVREGERVLVTARFAGGLLAGLDDLRAGGGRIVSSSRRLQTVTFAVDSARLPAIAAVPGLKAAWPVRKPVVHGSTTSAVGEGPCEGGSVISEGLGQLRVDDAREAFELRGKGIAVGVLSDSYDTASAPPTDAEDDILSGDLPGPAGSCSEQQLPVNVLDEGPAGESDEGRAMLQIAHDLAPKAELAFATAFESEEGFAQNIERLARPVSEGGAGAAVIVDDVAWFEEPFFQDGPVAVAINNVTAAGVSYLSATGNDNLFDSLGNEISSWEAPEFRDSGTCPAVIEGLAGFNGTHCMDFAPGAGVDDTFGITVQAGKTLTVNLQWAEPWNGVLSDLDAFLVSAGGSILDASFGENPGVEGTQRPVEIVQWKNNSSSAATVLLAINRFSGVSPRLKFILLQNGGGVSAVEYPESSGEDVVGPSIYGHAGAASAISVAAVPFNNSSVIEPYSSRGPVTHYFGPVEGPLPAAPLGSPQLIPKPDLAATDCGATTFFAFLSAGTWRFCGTSAAAPHAAAVAGLVRQAKPTFSEQQVGEVLAVTAVPVGSFTSEAAGAGLVDAFAAIDSLSDPIEGGDGPSETVPPLEEPEPVPSPAPAAVAETTSVVDQVAPRTMIVGHPRRVVKTGNRRAKVVFRFRSDQAQVTFLCKVDAQRWRKCPKRFVLRLTPGRHVVRVKARNADGRIDPTPAVFRFRVKRRG